MNLPKELGLNAQLVPVAARSQAWESVVSAGKWRLGGRFRESERDSLVLRNQGETLQRDRQMDEWMDRQDR